MKNLWYRWVHAKWHSKVPGMTFTRCGYDLREHEATSEAFESHAPPEDEHGVCLHCLRALEMQARMEATTHSQIHSP
jgi:hypothetical protein